MWFMDGNLIAGQTTNMLTVNAAGSYTVKVTDANSCASATSLASVVTVNPLPATPTISGTLSFCQGGSSTLTATGTGTFMWFLGGNLIAGQTTNTLSVNAAGNYTVKVTDANSCASATSAPAVVTVNTPIVVDAGAPQIVSACAALGGIKLAGVIGGAATSATWSGGAGTFTPNNTTLNATYTPAAAEIAAGSVTLTLTTDDPAGPCGADSAKVTITITPCADLSLTKTVDNNAPTIGQNVVFTIKVSNAGPSAATNVKVTDVLPAGLTFVSADLGVAYNSGTGVWTVGTIVSGGSATLKITATVTQPGEISNTAEVIASDQPDPDSTPNNQVPVEDDQARVSLNSKSGFDPPSDQKPGTLLVFPFYKHDAQNKVDTRLTVTNIGNLPINVHFLFMDGATCQEFDQFVCFTPGASIQWKASEFDPQNKGYVIAYTVDNMGRPVAYNGLSGNAFVNDGEYVDNYGAESFYSPLPIGSTIGAVATPGLSWTIPFDGVALDMVPTTFVVDIQSPADTVNQKLVLSGLTGDAYAGKLSGVTQIGTGLAYNGHEVLRSFSPFISGQCFVEKIIDATTPKVTGTLAGLIPKGEVGTLRFSVTAAVGLLMTSNKNTFSGSRTLHKVQVAKSSIIIPLVMPDCQYWVTPV